MMRHVGYGVSERRGDREIVLNRLGKGIGLQAVLIARIEDDFLGHASLLEPDPLRPIGRRVERNLDLDAALRADDVHPLVGANCVPQVNVDVPWTNSSTPEASRSTPSSGRARSSPARACGSASKMNRDSEMQ